MVPVNPSFSSCKIKVTITVRLPQIIKQLCIILNRSKFAGIAFYLIFGAARQCNCCVAHCYPVIPSRRETTFSTFQERLHRWIQIVLLITTHSLFCYWPKGLYSNFVTTCRISVGKWHLRFHSISTLISMY